MFVSDIILYEPRGIVKSHKKNGLSIIDRFAAFCIHYGKYQYSMETFQKIVRT